MNYVAYFLLLAFLGTWLTVALTRGQGALRNLLPLFWLSFLARAAATFVNQTFDFLGTKGASVIPMAWTERMMDFLAGRGASPPLIDKFMVQGILQVPISFAFGLDGIFLLLNNCLVGAMLGVVSYHYIRRVYGAAAGGAAFILFSLYPAAFAFSVFGLRDIILMLAVTLNLCSFIALTANPRFRELLRVGKRVPDAASDRTWRRDLLVWLISLAATAIMRRSMLPVIAVMVTLSVFFSGFWHAPLDWLRGRGSWVYWVSIATVVVIVATTLVGVYWFSFTITTSESFVSPIELLSDYSVYRFRRALRGSNFGSNILDYETYVDLPVAFRYALQVAGLLIVPMPWLLTSPSRFLAAADSVFLIACLIWAIQAAAMWSGNREDHWRRASVLALFVTFVIGVLALGTIIVNAGNAFRMRMSIAPFLLIPAAVFLGALWPRCSFEIPSRQQPAAEERWV